MWKCYLFGSGAIRCLFLILFRKKSSPNDKKIAKSLAVSRILLTFAIELEQAEKNGCDEDSNE